MKSFKTFIVEITGGRSDPTTTQPKRKNDSSRTIGDFNSFLENVKNYSRENKNIVVTNHESSFDINDKYHGRVSYSERDPERKTPRITIHSNRPGYEDYALMSYATYIDHGTIDGQQRKFISGHPYKTLYAELGKDVFRIPSNFLHSVATHLNMPVLSGLSQSPGAIKLWRGAVGYGHTTGQHVRRLLIKKHSNEFVDKGEVTPENIGDAYTGIIGRKESPLSVGERMSSSLIIHP